MKTFNVPIIYRSPLISAIKNKRRKQDRMKKDFSPVLLDFGPVRVYLARHFGFCYGVENAIEIAFRIIDENPGKRIYLLSEMIHNPFVNEDLQERGVKFLMDTYGKQLIAFDELNSDDIVIVPAFGTTMDIENKLKQIGIRVEQYNTTCPFVEKVWNRSSQIAELGYSVIVHGKPSHEETRATFSRSSSNAPTVVVNDMDETLELGKYITGEKPSKQFYEEFKGRYSKGFDVTRDLQKIGVVNQTTMLAASTQAIADYLKQVMIRQYSLSEKNIEERFADTRDTLCYATNDNQTAVSNMIDTPADLAIVIGGRNSSNSSHLVELCEEKLPTFFIRSEDDIISQTEIIHFDWRKKEEKFSKNFLPQKTPLQILITSGASSPDAMVEGVIGKVISYFPGTKSVNSLIEEFA
jgi:4-hydroxy-3-methylbut-2-en-1-yl diphosphate reductase